MSEIGIPDAVMASVMRDFGYGNGDIPPVEDAAGDAAPDVETADAPAEDPFADLVLDPAAAPEPDADESAADGTGEEDVVPPPAPPGGPLWEDDAAPAVPPTAVTLPDGRVLTAEQIAALANLDAQIRAGRPPWQQPAPTPTVPQTQVQQLPPLPALPQLTPEDLDNPAVAATMILLERQRREMDGIRAQIAQQNQTLAERQYAEVAEITRTAQTMYQQQYNLPDPIMQKIVATAAPLSDIFMTKWMRDGLNPRTGLPVERDGMKAMQALLDTAYWLTPDAAKFETERQMAHQSKVAARKQKLGGVGGSSGSAPRQPKPVDMSDPSSREAAMVAEIANLMGVGADE